MRFLCYFSLPAPFNTQFGLNEPYRTLLGNMLQSDEKLRNAESLLQ